MNESSDTKVGRREFVGLAAAATAGFTILKPHTVFGTQANSAVRLGLLGCGGRGTAVTESFLQNTGAIVTALGDVFQDNLDTGEEVALRKLTASRVSMTRGCSGASRRTNSSSR